MQNGNLKYKKIKGFTPLENRAPKSGNKYNLNFLTGFTLLEVLIYAGILAIVSGMIGGIFIIASRVNIITEINNELAHNMRFISENLRIKITTAELINNIAGSNLSLKMAESAKNPTVFSLSSNALNIKEGTGAEIPLNNPQKVRVTNLTFTLVGPGAAEVSPSDHYAWSGNLGWINFNAPGGNVLIPRGAGELRGLAQVISDNHWISLNCLSTDSCGTIEYKVLVNAEGELSGWAWSERFGWISFSCKTGGIDGGNICASSNYGVTIDQNTGEFNGYAWSGSFGWISFNCLTGGVNQSDICANSNYRVKDLRLQYSAVKVDITLTYNDPRPEFQLTKSSSFIFNLITPGQ